MSEWEAKAKLAAKLSSALHQAPDNPEGFATVIQQVLRSNKLHITDLAITIGDTTRRLQQELENARRSARPTLDNLIDLASKKVRLGRSPEYALGEVLGVPPKRISECKQLGFVPRSWFEKINALPDLDDSREKLAGDAARVAKILVKNGYSVEQIYEAFNQIRATRVTLNQITRVTHLQAGAETPPDSQRMRDELFGLYADADRRFSIWLATHLRKKLPDNGLGFQLTPDDVKRVEGPFTRELHMRQTDDVYRAAAAAADLIVRPPPGSTGHGAAEEGEQRPSLGELLEAIFPDQVAGGRAKRLAQLTGLNDRYVFDWLKGEDRPPERWLDFLAAVANELCTSMNGAAIDAGDLAGSRSRNETVQFAFDLAANGLSVADA